MKLYFVYNNDRIQWGRRAHTGHSYRGNFVKIVQNWSLHRYITLHSLISVLIIHDIHTVTIYASV